ncbi:ABC transporter permease [Pseudoteredinibacter isoporae]|uniref:ABC transporter permease n=1 Tax=Pseudoteredinibacter isoporae TaxID=570281 RepID=UPI003341DB4F
MKIYKKEMKDAIRDRRSVMAALSYSIGTPLIMCLLFVAMIDKFSSPSALYISVENARQAPELMRHLASRDIFPDSDVPEGEVVKAVSLHIDENYLYAMQHGELAKLTITADFSNDNLRSSIRRLQRELRSFSREVAALRLLTRGVSPEVIRVLDVQAKDTAKPEAKGGFIVGVAIFMMIYAVFISGMNLAIDTSAGERERNSLALMLSLPIRIRDLVLGKLFAVSSFALFGLCMILLVSKIAYSFVPWQDLGANVVIDTRFALYMLLFSFPLGLLAASMQLFVSFMAKTFKEAQSYLTIVLIVPMGMAMVTGYDIGPDVLRWLPVSGQQKALMEVVKGNALPWDSLLIATAITLLLTGVLVAALMKLLSSEKTVFSL